MSSISDGGTSCCDGADLARCIGYDYNLWVQPGGMVQVNVERRGACRVRCGERAGRVVDFWVVWVVVVFARRCPSQICVRVGKCPADTVPQGSIVPCVNLILHL